MCEEDYEVDENGKKLTHRLRLSVDDLIGQSTEEKSKKKISEPKKRKRSPSPQMKMGSKRKTGRSPATFSKGRRVDDDESEDLTKDMDDPVAEPNIIEVKPSSSHSISGPGTPTPKKDPETQPMKVRYKILNVVFSLLNNSLLY